MKRKRGNGKRKPNRPSLVGAKEAIPNVSYLSVNRTGLDDFDNAEFDYRMYAETLQADTNMSGRKAGLDNQGLVNERMEDNINSYRGINVASPLSKNARSITANSSREFGSSNINLSGNTTVQGEMTHQEEPRLPLQDSQHKAQELNAALLVIKKIMKMDAAQPFNVPVNPIALGIPDYFDVIDTPMDLGTICNNLQKGLKYMNSEDVFKDVQCIWDNCCKYNKKGDYILELMTSVKTDFMKHWATAGLYKEQPQAINGYSHLQPPMESTLRRSKRGQNCPVGSVIDNPDQHQQDQMGPSQVQSHQCSSIYSQVHQPQPSSNQQQPSLLQADVNIGTADSSHIQRRTRGHTRCLKVLNRKGRISITINELAEPIGLEAPKLINFLGTMARDGLMAPLTYVKWAAMPDANKENMWQKVQSKFEIDLKSKSWVMKSLSKKWKDWKSRLKASHYNAHATDKERLADRDERVLPDQWSILISHWNSKEEQERSTKNKANRARVKFSHTTGTKSFARLREEQRAKRPDGKEPSPAELFILTRTRKDGKPVNKASSAVISQLREGVTQQRETSQDSRRRQDDIFSQVMGQDRRGRMRTCGLGPSPPDLEGLDPTRAEAMRMVSEANAEVHRMKERMVAMEQICSQMASQMTTMMSMMSSMQRNDNHQSNIGETSGGSEGLPQQQVRPLSSNHAVPCRETRARKRGKMQNASTSKVNPSIN